VGDIKQSIYGFRGSEPSIFASYRRAMPLHTQADENADGVCVFMSENFRCNRPVIDFANRVCAFLFSACESSVGYRPQDDLVCAKPAPQQWPDGHPIPVQVNVFDAPPKRSKDGEDEEEGSGAFSEEALWTAGEIARLLREERLDDGTSISPTDVAILVRTKRQGEAYTKALQELGIPVASATAANVLQDSLMTELLNLLRAIDNPYRDLPLSEYLLSPLGGFTLEELTLIRDAAPESGALYDAMERMAASTEDSPLSRKTGDAVAWMERQRKQASAQPADRFLRLLYAEEPLRPLSRHAVLLFLYEQARIYQRSSWCGLYGFLDHFSKLLEGGNISADGFQKAPEAVTVMTVHHSKGLEFPVVFLCSCGNPFNKDDLKKHLLFHRDLGCATRLYNPDTGENEDNSLRVALSLKTDLEQTEESIRTLYVALTRARERLYVSGTLRGKWESAMSAASLIRRGNRSSILKCSNPLQWILAALLEKAPGQEESPWSLRHIPFGTVERGADWEVAPHPEVTEPAKAPVHTPTTQRYQRVWERQASFLYPRGYLDGLPTKAAASRLKPDLVDTLMDEE
ncbi:MAG: hypothetical protein IJX62_07955, partial [Clostridia bacterium]|nr:hypothetical protein [Clostridia bacterium]